MCNRYQDIHIIDDTGRTEHYIREVQITSMIFDNGFIKIHYMVMNKEFVLVVPKLRGIKLVID